VKASSLPADWNKKSKNKNPITDTQNTQNKQNTSPWKKPVVSFHISPLFFLFGSLLSSLAEFSRGQLFVLVANLKSTPMMCNRGAVLWRGRGVAHWCVSVLVVCLFIATRHLELWIWSSQLPATSSSWNWKSASEDRGSWLQFIIDWLQEFLDAS